jgi:hypothetical protein
MNKILPKTIVGLTLICCWANGFSQDYLVTNENDTIYGRIELKTNTSVVVHNKDGKQKFKATEAKFFQRGDFKFSSVKTSIPEFLLEIKKGEISYYAESHLKSRYTLNYTRQVYLKYKERVFRLMLNLTLSLPMMFFYLTFLGMCKTL